MRALTEEQELAAARRSGSLLLAAGAGSGKTAVLTERFVRAVREDGLAPSRILAITFTERAAGELRERIRARLLELSERDAAREAQSAFISTFHGFCVRVLRAHPLPAGLDPAFTVMDEGLASRLRRLAFSDALAGFVDGEPPEPVELVAAFGADALQDIVMEVYAQLRSQGHSDPRLPTMTGDEPGAGACRLIDDLLARFGAAYQTRKRARALVDFDDLELLARDLLQTRADIRQPWAERFQMLMVDEFQDTNARQLQLLELLDSDNLFTVGDERQSIYGFRHANVELFRERRRRLERAGAALRLTHNFRSRAPILAAVDRVFAARMGESHTPLLATREHAGTEPRVELLLSDCGGTEPWRQAEARLLAERVAALVRAGNAQPGEVAVLVRALGDLHVYEAALRRAGLPTLAAVGGFWGHQQVADLVAYLRALANPLDELALYSTLACPLVGLSSDGLAAVAQLARELRCDAWQTIERHGERLGERLGADDRRRVQVFGGWFAAERRSATLYPLAELLRRAIALAGYHAHVLSLQWGPRRMANVHKLLRLARSYEAQEGRDLRGFLDHVAHLGDALGAREADAPLPDGHLQAVRLMSIHAAKGLEFPVVCLADLGRAQRLTVPDLLVRPDGRIGLRLPVLGQAEAQPTLEYAALREGSQAAQQQEEDRILYVAMTRARERLLLSGAVDFARWPDPKQGSAPIAWLAPALVPDVTQLAERGQDLDVELGEGLRVRCAFNRSAQTQLSLPVEPVAQEAPESEAASLQTAAPRLSAGHSPAGYPVAGHPVAGQEPAPTATLLGPPDGGERSLPLSDSDATISYSSLAELERCGYRYYLERVLHLPEDRASAGQTDRFGLEARTRGTLVHVLLEAIDFACPRVPTDADVKDAARRIGASLDRDASDEIVALVAGALASPPASRLARALHTRREHPFSFSLGEHQPLVTGVLDLLAHESERAALVVDYKSDRLHDGEELEEIVARDYSIQRLVYALAAIEGDRNIEQVTVAHWFLERPQEWVCATYTADQAPALRERLLERLARLRAAGYTVAKEPHRGICLTCPGRSALCSWEEHLTLREPSAALETHDQAATLN